jgi:hypothetical protein
MRAVHVSVEFSLPDVEFACIGRVLCSPLKLSMFLPKRRLTFQRTTRRYIPEYSIIRDHRCGNLKSYEIMALWAVTSSNISEEIVDLIF